MATHLVSGLSQGFQGIVLPTWSPVPSPTIPRRLHLTVEREKREEREKQFFMEFSCLDECLGRVVIKVLQGAGQVGREFEFLMTGQNGFGYKGSRVYACCKDEWCLLGDLLYKNPPPPTLINTDWDPRLPEGRKENEGDGGEGGSLRKLYQGSNRGTRVQVDTKQRDTQGAVVAVASDYDTDTRSWILGPQIKLCLKDSVLRSGRVMGVLTEGMEVAQRLSRMGDRSYEPKARIDISNCGAL